MYIVLIFTCVLRRWRELWCHILAKQPLVVEVHRV